FGHWLSVATDNRTVWVMAATAAPGGEWSKPVAAPSDSRSGPWSVCGRATPWKDSQRTFDGGVDRSGPALSPSAQPTAASSIVAANAPAAGPRTPRHLVWH